MVSYLTEPYYYCAHCYSDSIVTCLSVHLYIPSRRQVYIKLHTIWINYQDCNVQKLCIHLADLNKQLEQNHKVQQLITTHKNLYTHYTFSTNSYDIITIFTTHNRLSNNTPFKLVHYKMSYTPQICKRQTNLQSISKHFTHPARWLNQHYYQ